MTLTKEEIAAEAEDIVNEESEVEILELNDDDFLKLTGPPVLAETEKDDKEEDEDLDENKDEDSDEDLNSEEEEEEEDKENPLEFADEDIEKALHDKKEKELDSDLTDKNEGSDKDKKEVSKTEIDYETEYKKITASFKANGHEMSVKNSDDAIRLMQMGANYHKKMAGLKPSLRILKLLEKNDLLEETDLNFLIDLKNKNPEAITKLLKDSGMDPLDVDIKKDSNYVPTQRPVNDTELDLDAVLGDIQDTPTYQETLNVITNVWDTASRNHIAKEPQIIVKINEHIADGTYDKVASVVTYERGLGRLTGLSDLEAYYQIGRQMHEAGKLNQPEASITENKEKPPVIPVKPKKDSQKEAKRKAKKKAVSPTKNAGTPTAKQYDPLAMSDEDFEKIDPKQFGKPK